MRLFSQVYWALFSDCRHYVWAVRCSLAPFNLWPTVQNRREAGSKGKWYGQQQTGTRHASVCWEYLTTAAHLPNQPIYTQLFLLTLVLCLYSISILRYYTLAPAYCLCAYRYVWSDTTARQFHACIAYLYSSTVNWLKTPRVHSSEANDIVGLHYTNVNYNNVGNRGIVCISLFNTHLFHSGPG